MLTLVATRDALTACKFSPKQRKAYLDRCRQLLGIDDKPEGDRGSGDASGACSGDANEESLDV